MFVLFFFLILVGCSPGNAAPTYNGILVAIGDSITVGTGASTGFAQRIAYARDYALDNRGVGSTLVRHHVQDILKIPPTPGVRVVFLTAYNDMIFNGEDPMHLAEYIQDLRTALDHLESIEMPTFVGLPLNFTQDILDYAVIMKLPLTARTSALYTQAILEGIKGYRYIQLVDTHSYYQPTRQTTSGTHPNDVGADIIARVFLAAGI